MLIYILFALRLGFVDTGVDGSIISSVARVSYRSDVAYVASVAIAKHKVTN